MSVFNRNIKDAMAQATGFFGLDIVAIMYCTVDSVDEAGKTCDCTPITGISDASLPGVLLNSESNAGFTLIPEVGSTIIVGLSNTNKAFLILAEDLDKIYLIPNTLIQMFDGSFGGLTKTQELKTQLDKNNQILQSILTILKGPPINEPGNGTPSALQAALSVALAGKVVGDFSNIENSKILHGK
jgi:hypothetical protein